MCLIPAVRLMGLIKLCTIIPLSSLATYRGTCKLYTRSQNIHCTQLLKNILIPTNTMHCPRFELMTRAMRTCISHDWAIEAVVLCIVVNSKHFLSLHTIEVYELKKCLLFFSLQVDRLSIMVLYSLLRPPH